MPGDGRKRWAERVPGRTLEHAGSFAALALLAAAAWQRRWSAEDSFINYRVIDQLLHGHGPVYNQGERVEVFTSPLWLAILAVAKFVFGFVAVEWIGVGLGMGLSLLGVWLGIAAGTRLFKPTSGERSIVVPCAALVLAGLSPFWDFMSSGLETGLSFAWLGAAFYAMVRVAEVESGRRAVLAAGVIGLGPLVRPDFALIAGALALCLLLGLTSRTRVRLWCLAVLVAPVAVYQVFRMAYYASLVPNTALAKAAGGSAWGRGFDYVADLVAPHFLWIPIGVLVALALVHRQFRDLDPKARLICASLLGGALLHVIYIVRVGGDYMHGRFLLPGLFCLLLPVSCIRLERPDRKVLLPATLVVLVWLVAGIGWLRPPYAGRYDQARGLTDERGFWSAIAQDDHPVTLDDYRRTPNYAWGTELRRASDAGRSVVYYVPPGTFALTELGPDPLRRQTVFAGGELGITGVKAGRDVYILDRRGLASPIASRLEITSRDGATAGHEKYLDMDWVRALLLQPSDQDPEGVINAREALGCGDLLNLQNRLTDELSIATLARNLTDSVGLTTLAVPPSPADALRRFC